MIIQLSVQPGNKIYWLDVNDASIGEVDVNYAKIVTLNTGLEVQYIDMHDSVVCTEKEISNKISRDGLLYFRYEAIRDAYRERYLK